MSRPSSASSHKHQTSHDGQRVSSASSVHVSSQDGQKFERQTSADRHRNLLEKQKSVEIDEGLYSRQL